MSVTIQVRRDTAAIWTSTDPVLYDGEIGLETDTGNAKIGDGSTAWTSLAYWEPGGKAAMLSPSGDATGVADTAALTALGGGRIQLAPGTFYVNNFGLANGTYLTGAGQGSTILKLPAGADGCVLTNSGGSESAGYTTSTSGSVTGNQYIGLQDLTVDGNYTAAGGSACDAVNFTGCGHVTLLNVELQNAARYGIFLSGNQFAAARYSSVDNVTAHGNQSHGIWISNGQRVVSSKNVTGYSNGGHGLFFDASECQVNGAYAFQNGLFGIKINNVFDCVYDDLKAHQNAQHGIYATSWTDGSGSGWQAFENGTSGTTGSGYADIYFDDTAGTYGVNAGITVTGVRAGALYDPSHRWVTTGPSTIYTPDYALYMASGLGTGANNGIGHIYFDDVLLGAAGVESLYAPTRAVLTPGSNLWVSEAGQSGSPGFAQLLGTEYVTSSVSSITITVANGVSSPVVTASTTTKGNTIFVAAHGPGASPPAGVTDSRGNSYTQDAFNATGSTAALWRAKNATPLQNGDTITVAFGNTQADYAAVAWEHRKVVAASPVDGTPATATGTTVSTLATGSTTTANPYSGLIAVLSTPTATTVTPPAGFISRINFQNAAAVVYVAELVPYTVNAAAATGTYSGTWTLGASMNCGSLLVAYKP